MPRIIESNDSSLPEGDRLVLVLNCENPEHWKVGALRQLQSAMHLPPYDAQFDLFD
jgi:hypothetical protein